VEFYHKKNATSEILILLNHTGESQEINISSKNNIHLKNVKTDLDLGKGKDFNVKLKPAEVLFLWLKR